MVRGGIVAPSARSEVGPRQLGRYELLHEIASGGMATVFLARPIGSNTVDSLVAIKCCHAHLREDEDFAAMFMDEARLASKIHHPNVVATLEVGTEDPLFLVMEYINGDRLSNLIRAALERKRHTPIPIVLRVLTDTLKGLAAAHGLTDKRGRRLNIVHRDVSPHNILVGVDGISRITDFGIAKAEARLTSTREGQIKGKISYMAPEQATGRGVTERADLFSIGVVAWEMLTTSRLFRGENDVEALYRLLQEPIDVPSTRVAGIPPAIDAIVMRALEREAPKRFATADEFLAAIARSGIAVASDETMRAYVGEMLRASIDKRNALLSALLERNEFETFIPTQTDGAALRHAFGSLARSEGTPITASGVQNSGGARAADSDDSDPMEADSPPTLVMESMENYAPPPTREHEPSRPNVQLPAEFAPQAMPAPVQIAAPMFVATAPRVRQARNLRLLTWVFYAIGMVVVGLALGISFAGREPREPLSTATPAATAPAVAPAPLALPAAVANAHAPTVTPRPVAVAPVRVPTVTPVPVAVLESPTASAVQTSQVHPQRTAARPAPGRRPAGAARSARPARRPARELQPGLF